MGPIALLLTLLLLSSQSLGVFADIRITVDVASVIAGVGAPVSWTRGAQDPARFFLQSVLFGSQIGPFNLVEVNAGTRLQGNANIVSLFPGPHIILAFTPGTTQTISTSNVFDVTEKGRPPPSSTRQPGTITSFAIVTSTVFRTALAGETGSINSEDASKSNCRQEIIAPAVLAAAFGIATAILTFILFRWRRPPRQRPVHIQEPEAKPPIRSIQDQPVWSPLRLEGQAGSPISAPETNMGNSYYTYQTIPSQSSGRDPTYGLHHWEGPVRGVESRYERESVISEAPTVPLPLYRRN